jgi:hypothetical protein
MKLVLAKSKILWKSESGAAGGKHSRPSQAGLLRFSHIFFTHIALPFYLFSHSHGDVQADA